VTKYSDLVESISAIFAANAGECSVLTILISVRLAANRLPVFEEILSLAPVAAVSICDLTCRAGRDALSGPLWGLSQLAFPCRPRNVGRLCQTAYLFLQRSSPQQIRGRLARSI